MQIEFLAGNLENYIPLLIKNIPVRSQVPILSNIKIEARSSGIYFSATDLEFGTEVMIPGKVVEEGVVTVSGREFLDTMTMITKDKIEITSEKDAVRVKGVGTNALFQTISHEEFPSLYQEKGNKTCTFTKAEFDSIMPYLLFSVSMDDLRPELSGILISQQEKNVDFVSTDGFRLSLVTREQAVLGIGTQLIIPTRIVQEVIALKKQDDIVLYVNEESNQIIFEIGEVLLVGRIIQGGFPNYRKVVPSQSNTKITVSREDLLQIVRLSSVFARDSANVVYLMIEEGKVKISAKASGVGEQESVVDGAQEGESVKIAFNAKFLIDILKGLTSKEIEVSVNSSVEPALFTTPELPHYLHVIMPVRVQE